MRVRVLGDVYTASDESGDACRFTVELARLASARADILVGRKPEIEFPFATA